MIEFLQQFRKLYVDRSIIRYDEVENIQHDALIESI